MSHTRQREGERERVIAWVGQKITGGSTCPFSSPMFSPSFPDPQEFLMGCLRLRGSARSMDVAKLMYDQVMVFELLGISGDAVPKETADSFV